VLESVLRQVDEHGVVDVGCRPDVDPAVVAAQLRAYAEGSGRSLRCRAVDGHVEVRGTGRLASARAAHPAAGAR